MLWSIAIRLFDRFRINHMQHVNDIYLEVHEPAFSVHFYRPTSDHQAVPECKRAVGQSARHNVAIWLSHTQLLPLTKLIYVRFAVRLHTSGLVSEALPLSLATNRQLHTQWVHDVNAQCPSPYQKIRKIRIPFLREIQLNSSNEIVYRNLFFQFLYCDVTPSGVQHSRQKILQKTNEALLEKVDSYSVLVVQTILHNTRY